MKKTALLYDPYFDTQGGGERYLIFFAKCLNRAGFQVTLAWHNPDTLKRVFDRFGVNPQFIKLDAVAFDLFQKSGNLIQKRNFSSPFDVSFWISDGSIPFLFAKRNIIHYQYPFTPRLETNPVIKFFKLSQINHIVYNSFFTRNVLETQLPKNKGVVIYPPIDTKIFGSKKQSKSNTILSVARFDSPSHPKRHDVLIKAFADVHKQCPDYSLVLAGGLKGEDSSLDSLKDTINSLPIKIIANPSIDQLVKLYSKAKIFWHAAGYDIDETVHPESVEHFGMTTVEAMSAGCVPLVMNKGGQKEIINVNSGILWNSLDELAQATVDLIHKPKQIKNFSRQAIIDAEKFNVARFNSQILSLVT